MFFIKLIPFIMLGALTAELGYSLTSWEFWAFLGILVSVKLLEFLDCQKG